jgi:lysophospholipase L1-like esterase
MACNGGLSALPDVPPGAADGSGLSGSPYSGNPGLPGGPTPGGPKPPYVPPPPDFQFEGQVSPIPLISRFKPTYSSFGNQLLSRLTNGLYRWDIWQSNGQAGWISIHVGHGESTLPSRVLLEWSSGANYSYTDAANIPRQYRIEVSSTGEEGSWEEQVNVSDNSVRTRTHVLELQEGIAWVRMHLPSGTIQLDEIDIHDLSNAGNHFDSWFFLGDSNGAHAFDRSTAHGSFAEMVHAQGRGFFPAMVNGGVGGNKTSDALDRLESALNEHPAIQFWAVSLGTNNVGGINSQEFARFRREMLEIIRLIQEVHGRVAFIANIPFIGTAGATCQPGPYRQGIHEYNRIIKELIEETNALPGPDLYAYFERNCEQLAVIDGLHFTAEGHRAVNALWAHAVAPIYGGPAPEEPIEEEPAEEEPAEEGPAEEEPAEEEPAEEEPAEEEPI